MIARLPRYFLIAANAGAAALLLAMPVTAGAAGAEARTTCPPALERDAINVVRPPQGWIGSTPSRLRLTGGGMMSGDRSRMGYLKPLSATRLKGETTLTWRFDAGEEKWMWCSYGARAAQLSRRLDDKATICTVVYKDSPLDGIAYMYGACAADVVVHP